VCAELGLGVRRLAQAGVAEARPALELADADAARLVEPCLDAVPRRVLEVERDLQVGRQRPEQELEDPLVARALHGDADGPEPVAERPDALLEGGDGLRPVRGELDGEPEAVGRRGGPAVELLLRRKPVAGRVQLDGSELLRVEGEELARVEPGRVEPRAPRWVRPAGSADVEPIEAFRGRR